MKNRTKLLISTAVSLLLTPALIRGWAGLPQMGVASGAYAAGVAFVVAMAWTAWYLLQKKDGRPHPLAPDGGFVKHLRIDGGILRKVLKIGLPTGLSMITVSIAEIAVLFLVNGGKGPSEIGA